jgi:hypothetical protein
MDSADRVFPLRRGVLRNGFLAMWRGESMGTGFRTVHTSDTSKDLIFTANAKSIVRSDTSSTSSPQRT